IGIKKGLYMHLVDDRVLVPERIANECSAGVFSSHESPSAASGARCQMACARARFSSTVGCHTTSRCDQSSGLLPGLPRDWASRVPTGAARNVLPVRCVD